MIIIFFFFYQLRCMCDVCCGYAVRPIPYIFYSSFLELCLLFPPHHPSVSVCFCPFLSVSVSLNYGWTFLNYGLTVNYGWTFELGALHILWNPKMGVNIWITGELLNFEWTFELRVTFLIMHNLLVNFYFCNPVICICEILFFLHFCNLFFLYYLNFYFCLSITCIYVIFISLFL